jgi:hypothetical protein
MRVYFFISCLIFTAVTFTGNAQHTLEAGTGWQNTGATEKLSWWPDLQGSRKDIPVFIGWRYVGQKRFYYTPYARFIYLNTWSIGGAMNMLNASFSPTGMGVYLTKPPAAYKPEERVGKWFVSFNVNAAFRFGVNVTPHGPKSQRVPNPEEYKQNLQWRLNHQDSLGITLFDFEQHYPYGQYGYVAVDLPVQIRVNTVVKNGYGVGFFIESNAALFEWFMDGKTYRLPYAYGYSMTAGFSFVFSKMPKRG